MPLDNISDNQMVHWDKHCESVSHKTTSKLIYEFWKYELQRLAMQRCFQREHSIKYTRYRTHHDHVESANSNKMITLSSLQYAHPCREFTKHTGPGLQHFQECISIGCTFADFPLTFNRLGWRTQWSRKMVWPVGERKKSCPICVWEREKQWSPAVAQETQGSQDDRPGVLHVSSGIPLKPDAHRCPCQRTHCEDRLKDQLLPCFGSHRQNVSDDQSAYCAELLRFFVPQVSDVVGACM